MCFKPLGNAFKVVRMFARQRCHLFIQDKVLFAHCTVDTIVHHRLGDLNLGQAFNIFLGSRRWGVSLVLLHELGDDAVELRLRVDVVSTGTRRGAKQTGKDWKLVGASRGTKQRSKKPVFSCQYSYTSHSEVWTCVLMSETCGGSPACDESAFLGFNRSPPNPDAKGWKCGCPDLSSPDSPVFPS